MFRLAMHHDLDCLHCIYTTTWALRTLKQTILPSLRRITISDCYCFHTIVTILPYLHQVQTSSVYLVWAMHMQSDWHTTTLTIYIAADNVGYVARWVRTSPTVVIQPDCGPAPSQLFKCLQTLHKRKQRQRTRRH